MSPAHRSPVERLCLVVGVGSSQCGKAAWRPRAHEGPRMAPEVQVRPVGPTYDPAGHPPPAQNAPAGFLQASEITLPGTGTRGGQPHPHPPHPPHRKRAGCSSWGPPERKYPSQLLTKIWLEALMEAFKLHKLSRNSWCSHSTNAGSKPVRPGVPQVTLIDWLPNF